MSKPVKKIKSKENNIHKKVAGMPSPMGVTIAAKKIPEYRINKHDLVKIVDVGQSVMYPPESQSETKGQYPGENNYMNRKFC